jgi:hypothetical protein
MNEEDQSSENVYQTNVIAAFSNYSQNEYEQQTLQNININDKVQELLIGEGNESLINKIKNDAILKKVFKSREAEVIEDIKSKNNEYAEDNNEFFIVDLMDFFYKLKNEISKSDNDTKSIDDFINYFCNELDNAIEEKLKTIS